MIDATKLIAIAIFELLVFSSGVLVEYKFHLAGEATQAKEQVDKAQEGQNKIIEFHQKIQRVYVKSKDTCLTAPVPADVQLLLK